MQVYLTDKLLNECGEQTTRAIQTEETQRLANCVSQWTDKRFLSTDSTTILRWEVLTSSGTHSQARHSIQIVYVTRS